MHSSVAKGGTQKRRGTEARNLTDHTIGFGASVVIGEAEFPLWGFPSLQMLGHQKEKPAVSLLQPLTPRGWGILLFYCGVDWGCKCPGLLDSG